VQRLAMINKSASKRPVEHDSPMQCTTVGHIAISWLTNKSKVPHDAAAESVGQRSWDN
jgi:hypothetical protein